MGCHSNTIECQIAVQYAFYWIVVLSLIALITSPAVTDLYAMYEFWSDAFALDVYKNKKKCTSNVPELIWYKFIEIGVAVSHTKSWINWIFADTKEITMNFIQLNACATFSWLGFHIFCMLISLEVIMMCAKRFIRNAKKTMARFFSRCTREIQCILVKL